MPAPTLEDLRRRADGAAEDFAAKKAAKLDDFSLDDARAAEDNDSSRRAYYKEFVKVVEVSDVIIQVLDARDPLACRSPEVERFVRRANPDKRVVLLLNKIDLAPKENVRGVAQVLPRGDALRRVQVRDRRRRRRRRRRQAGRARGGLPTKGSYGGKDALGGETLLQLLKNYARNRNLKTAITVGIVGFPNVGKSSLINSLKRSRSAAAVGNTPGMTKVSKEIVLDKHVKLIDSPGVVFASSLGESAGVTALRNCVKVERLADPIAPVCEILRRCPQEQLMLMYKIGAFDDVDAFLRAVGKLRGVLKGGVPDMLAAARVVLNDWNGGRIVLHHAPARGARRGQEARGGGGGGRLGQEFDAEKVFEDEENAVIAGLPELDDADVEFVPAQTAGVAQLDAAGEERRPIPRVARRRWRKRKRRRRRPRTRWTRPPRARRRRRSIAPRGSARREARARMRKRRSTRGARFGTAQRAGSMPARPAPRRRRRRRLRRRLPRRGGGRQRGPISSGRSGRVNPSLAREELSVCLLSLPKYAKRAKVDYVSTFFYGPEDVPLAYTRVSVVSWREARQDALSRRFVRLPAARPSASVAPESAVAGEHRLVGAARGVLGSSWCHVQKHRGPGARGRRRRARSTSANTSR